jgi:hypothetical protein
MVGRFSFNSSPAWLAAVRRDVLLHENRRELYPIKLSIFIETEHKLHTCFQALQSAVVVVVKGDPLVIRMSRNGIRWNQKHAICLVTSDGWTVNKREFHSLNYSSNKGDLGGKFVHRKRKAVSIG